MGVALLCLLAGPARAQSITAFLEDASTPLTTVQPAESELVPAAPAAGAAPLASGDVFNRQRIMGVIPDYQTVDLDRHAPPLTAQQKWTLAWKESVDPFNIFSAAIGASFSQGGNQTPKYGEGWPAYGKRFGAAVADMDTQSIFSAGLLATVLRQDPRYFRIGPREKVPKRVLLSLRQLFVTRQDSGREAFNASNLGGMMLGIAASNLYYPAPSRRGSVMAGRLETSMFGGVTGNLMSEFWPDIRDRFFLFRHKGVSNP